MLIENSFGKTLQTRAKIIGRAIESSVVPFFSIVTRYTQKIFADPENSWKKRKRTSKTVFIGSTFHLAVIKGNFSEEKPVKAGRNSMFSQ